MPEVPPPPDETSQERAEPASEPVPSSLWTPPEAAASSPPPASARRGPFDDLFSEREEPGPFGLAPPAADALGQGGLPRFPMPEYAGAAAAGGAVAVPLPRRGAARPAGRLIREIAETVILALAIFLIVRAVVQNFQVEGRSMQPTLETGWYVLVNKAVYWEIDLRIVHKFIPFVHPGDHPTRFIFGGPHRGDVVVFKAPKDVTGPIERDFIKRIIGLPGDTVEIRDCTLYVNGKPKNEPYINGLMTGSYGPRVVPDDQYFVLGDNRNNSSDSRAWGMLPKANLIGKAWLIYWPFHHFGLVKTEAPKSVDTTSANAKPAPACASASG